MCQDNNPFETTLHLLRRLGDSPAAGYADYQRAEESLTNCEPKRVSKLTEQISVTVDYAVCSKKRIRDFQHLHDRLGDWNLFDVNAEDVSGPLCYPFMTNDNQLRQRLLKSRIFISTYWPDAIERVSTEWARRFIRNLLPLPVEQRYGIKDTERVVSIILGGRV